MNILGLTIARTKALQLQPLSGRNQSGWWPLIRESFTGAWQQNVEIRAESVLTYSAVYACVSLIAGDISKLGLRLVAKNSDGIWSEAESPSFSPVLRKPNRYQTRIKFVEQWLVSKLTRGNAYILKARDARGVVDALYVLDPSRVTPLVTPDGSVYYEIRRDDLSGLRQESLVVPAREIIHDIMCALYHPLIGVSPIYASGVAALQGLSIQNNSHKFFSNGSNPSGFLTAPGAISDATAVRLKTYWDTNFTGDNVGKVAVGGDGLKYEPFTMSAVDSALIEQLKWTAETVCSAFHVPPFKIGIGPQPTYNNIEALNQGYYTDCLQSLIENVELCLDEGLELKKAEDGRQYGTEFDLHDLLRMDTATKVSAAQNAIGSGAMSPNEARFRFFDLGPVDGGDSPMVQQQYYSLASLARRDENDPFSKPVAPSVSAAPAAPAVDAPVNISNRAASFGSVLHRKFIAAGLHHAAA